MRRQRTIYFDDARHYYLFVFEPPMAMEDAWSPIDQVVGTAVDTFAYGVARGDGVFYPSRVATRFGTDIQPFEQAAYWRVWHNMQSLMDRGLDPLRVLVDRAHEKGMDFIASLRIGNYTHKYPEHSVMTGGRGFVHEEVRAHQLDVLRELAVDYPVDGIELDIASAPGGGAFLVSDEDAAEYTPTITSWVRDVAAMARSREGDPAVVGARVFPTEEMCLRHGLDVRAWLKEGIVDYIVPLLYVDFTLDPDMPIDWLVEAAHEADVSVYAMLQPYVANEKSGAPERVYASPDNMHAAASNFWDRGVDGMYTWFMRWPLGDAQRRTLSDLGDPETLREASKHYVLRRRSDQAVNLGYDAALPVSIAPGDTGQRRPVSFYVSDDFDGSNDRIVSARLSVRIRDLVSADVLRIELNGNSLEGERWRRSYGDVIGPFGSQWLEIALEAVRPRKGWNTLDFALVSRPPDLAGTIVVEDVELLVEYGPYPSRPTSRG